jgi:hypothetical protein
MAGLVAAAFEQCGIRDLLGGSLASTAMGEPRATLDIDLVADPRTTTLPPWLAAIGKPGSRPPEATFGSRDRRAQARVGITAPSPLARPSRAA